MNMAYEKVVAAYDTAAHAQSAIAALRAGGFADADISVIDQARVRSVVSDIDTRADAHGIWHSLFGHDVHEHEAEVYHRAVKMNGVVLAVRVMDREVAHALGILNSARPIDVNDRAITSGLAEPARVEAIARKLDSVPLAANQTVAVTPKLAAVHDEVLRLAEEQLNVGKEMVETGETRVRRFVTEREVAQDITLHEEHAQIMRRVVTDPSSIVDIDWADRTIHVVETAEHALVSKSARVVEEVELSKIGSDHVETVHEKLRRQQVEIERVGADGKRIARA
jgi:uncharacterized protein (TIGR02271 family)